MNGSFARSIVDSFDYEKIEKVFIDNLFRRVVAQSEDIAYSLTRKPAGDGKPGPIHAIIKERIDSLVIADETLEMIERLTMESFNRHIEIACEEAGKRLANKHAQASLVKLKENL